MDGFNKEREKNTQDLARILTNVLFRQLTEENAETGEEKT